MCSPGLVNPRARARCTPQPGGTTGVFLLVILCFQLSGLPVAAQEAERRITVKEYRQKMSAGWIGQMAGVGWGFPTEFKWLGEIIPEAEVPQWRPDMINVFDQDDLYVEMTFLRTLEEHGFDVTANQAGIDFANSRYQLWVANREGRDNLRAGIAPPDSGHPRFNPAADAIDYQIEADYSGLIAPGLPNIAIELGEKFGRIMNYGDGLYGGQFVGAMYAEAFFEDDPARIVTRALRAIPRESQYAEAVRDVLRWYAENPDDWERTWALIDEKYHRDPAYRQFTYQGPTPAFNIDAKLNGAYIVLGLLYGEGDPAKTIRIAMRAGQDSDCNPSNAGGILLTALGYDGIPAGFVSALDTTTRFSFTEYTFPDLVDVSEKLARQAVIRSGGRIEIDADGEEVFVVPVRAPAPSALQQSHRAGEISGSTFSAQEWSRIEGSKAFRYALVCIVLTALLAIRQNRESRNAYALLAPLALALGAAAYVRSVTPGDILGTINLDALVESLCAGFALLLLLQPLIAWTGFRGWLFSTLLAALVLGAAGLIGALGAQEARITATFKLTLSVYFVLAAAWLSAALAAGAACRRHFSYLRFTLVFIVASFVAGFSIVSIVLVLSDGSRGPLDLALQELALYGTSPILTLLMLPFLALAAMNATYDRRVRAWLGATQ